MIWPADLLDGIASRSTAFRFARQSYQQIGLFQFVGVHPHLNIFHDISQLHPVFSTFVCPKNLNSGYIHWRPAIFRNRERGHPNRPSQNKGSCHKLSMTPEFSATPVLMIGQKTLGCGSESEREICRINQALGSAYRGICGLAIDGLIGDRKTVHWVGISWIGRLNGKSLSCAFQVIFNFQTGRGAGGSIMTNRSKRAIKGTPWNFTCSHVS